jgi:O-antigen ligase
VFMFFFYSTLGKLKLLMGVVVVLFVGVAILPSSLARRFTTFFSSEDAYEDVMQGQAVGSAHARVNLLKNSIIMTLKNPVFGVGPGNFVNVDANDSEIAGRRGAWTGTHNTYTEVSSEGGIPALIFFIGVLVTCWRELTVTRRLNKLSPYHPRSREIHCICYGLQICLVGYLVQFFFIHMAYSALLTTLVGIIVSVTQTAKTEIKAYSAEAASIN